MAKCDSNAFLVRALWDDEASVWVATSEDVPGLVAEAATMEELIGKLKVMIPELLELNGVMPRGRKRIPFHLHTEVDAFAEARG